MYNNPYMYNYQPNYNQQSINDRIDNQIAQLQQMKEQMKSQQPTSINQTFQLAPTNNGKMKYVGTIDDVNKEHVTEETPLKDSKDMLIDALMLQIEDLKKEVNNAKSNNTNDDEPTSTKESSNVSNTKSTKEK